MTALPLWAILALASALATTAIPLVQEKFKAEGFSLALWVKIFIALFMVPFVWTVGAPQDPLFYFYVALTAGIYCISDVFYYRAVPVVGSGLMTRLLPASVIMTFLLWFIVQPSLLIPYWENPVKGGAIVIILLFFALCATRAKRCDVSWQGVIMIWPVLAAACVGPIFTKLALNHANAMQASFSYVFFQGLMMVAIYLVTYKIRRPVTRAMLLAPHTIKTGALLAIVGAVSVLLKTRAIQLVDNPAFVAIILFTDCLWVLLIYRLRGQKENGNIWAGLGIVLCAMLLVLVKSTL